MNPVSGQGRAAERWRRAREVLRRGGLDLEERAAGEPLHAWALAERAARDGRDMVIAVGGDGTIHEVLNGLVRGGAGRVPALGVIPAGTGNIFAHALRLPTDPARAAAVVLGGAVRRIDLGRVNDRLYATVAGVGFDGEVVHRVARGRLRGKAGYLLTALALLPRYRPSEAAVTIDGRREVGPLYFLTAANTAWYGGGLWIAPAARPDDGTLDVVTAAGVSGLRAAAIILRAFRGTHLGRDGVAHTPAREVRVEARAPLRVQADGEALGTVPATFQVVPAALDVIVPGTPAGGPGGRRQDMRGG